MSFKRFLIFEWVPMVEGVADDVFFGSEWSENGEKIKIKNSYFRIQKLRLLVSFGGKVGLFY